MNVNVSLMEESVIQIKSRIAINVDLSVKYVSVWESHMYKRLYLEYGYI